jgi:hypothetical protein
MHAVNQPDVPPSARVAVDTFTGKLCRPGTSMICVMPNGGRLWSWDWSMTGAPHEGARAIAKSFAQFLCKMSEARLINLPTDAAACRSSDGPLQCFIVFIWRGQASASR